MISDLQHELHDLIVSLVSAGLAVDTNSPVLRQGPSGRTSLSWEPMPAHPVRLPDDWFGTVAEYRVLLLARQYNFLLSDGSMVQISYEYVHRRLVRHRLAYYPCPVRLSLDDGDYQGGIDELFDWCMLQALEENDWACALSEIDRGEVGDTDPTVLTGRPRLTLRPALRFDFDRAAQGPAHPAAHVHVSHSECRLPIYGPLSLGHFVRFVFRHYYPSAWQVHGFLRTWPLRTYGRTVTQDERGELYMEWAHTS